MGEYIKAVFILMSGILGLCVGSFLNVVIYRIPEGLSLSYPPSHCPSCNYKLKWYDNIPVLSYLMLGGKCRGCRGHISFRYTAVEILNTLLWILSAYIYRENMPYGIISMIMISVFVSVFFIDLERGIIPDRFHIIIAVASIAALFFDKSTGILSHFIGLLASGAIFISLYYISYRIYGKEALGGGDVKLLTVLGFFFGWKKFLLLMVIFSISAVLVLLLIKLIRRDGRDTEYPLAPFITLAACVVLFFGTQILEFYTKALFNF